MMLAILSLLGSEARAGAAEGFACLDAVDLPCVEAELKALGADSSPETLALTAELHFHQGRFAQAVEVGQKVPAARLQASVLGRFRPRGALMGDWPGMEQGWAAEVELFQATLAATQDLVETRRGDVVIVHDPGIESILVDDAVDAVEKARAEIAPLLGGEVPGDLRVELYPTVAAFQAASSLPIEAVKGNGVVAISKWSRLLVVSPRAYGRGYGWRDTLVHEWIHRVVAYRSADGVPVWLQEGFAKGLDWAWRTKDFDLPVRYQSLLAGALQTGQFVPFSMMHPSFALIESRDASQLAYAQVGTQVHFLRSKGGDGILARIVKDLRGGGDSFQIVARAAGYSDFPAFEAAWKEWLGGLKLIGVEIADMNPEAEGDDIAADPVLSRRHDLANRARLGELMLERGHYEAALQYLREAVPEDAPASPHVARRTAEALAATGEVDQAVQVLRENAVYYPEVAINRKLAGSLLRSQHRDREAYAEYLASAEINPFSVDVQQALAELAAQLGMKEEARRRQGYLVVLLQKVGE